MRLALTDKERIQSEQEQLLEARLNEIESLSEGDGHIAFCFPLTQTV